MKLSTCCLKKYPVVLSFNAHYQNFEYNSKAQSQKVPNESIPQSQKFSSKSMPHSPNFQATNYPKLVHIPVLPHSEVPPPGGVRGLHLPSSYPLCMRGYLKRTIDSKVSYFFEHIGVMNLCHSLFSRND